MKLFSRIKEWMSLSETPEEQAYRYHCLSIREKVDSYEPLINEYLRINGFYHVERVFDSLTEYEKRKHVDIYGFIVFQIMEEEANQVVNRFIEKKGFANVIGVYLRKEDRLYYDKYGNRTPEFNRWVLEKACHELGLNAQSHFSVFIHETEHESEHES